MKSDVKQKESLFTRKTCRMNDRFSGSLLIHLCWHGECYQLSRQQYSRHGSCSAVVATANFHKVQDWINLDLRRTSKPDIHYITPHVLHKQSPIPYVFHNLSIFVLFFSFVIIFFFFFIQLNKYFIKMQIYSFFLVLFCFKLCKLITLLFNILPTLKLYRLKQWVPVIDEIELY